MLFKMRDPTLSNPFVIDRPVTNQVMFVGRELSFKWLEDELSREKSIPPLTLEGPRGIGKTSFLFKLATGHTLQTAIPIYLDVADLPLDNLSEFLWKLAKITMGELERVNVKSPTLEKRLLILRPWQAFNQHFWRYLPSSTNGRSILFLLDNFDILVGSEYESQTLSIVRQRLFELFQSDSRIAVLFTLTGRIQAFDPGRLAPFDIARGHRLSSFDLQETTELLTQAASFPVFSNLASLIFELTSGHPGDVQRLCFALHERGRSRKLRQLTLSDFLAVLDSDLKPKEFHTSVYRQKDHLSLNISRETILD